MPPEIMPADSQSASSHRAPTRGPARLRRARTSVACLVTALTTAFTCLAAPLSTAPATAAAPHPQAHVARTRVMDGIQLGIAFDYNAPNASALSENVAYIWGGYFLNWILPLHPLVPRIDGYMSFDSDPWSQSSPGHSLQYWRSVHPDWIVYRCDRRTPAYYSSNDTSVSLDFTNPAVRAWQLAQLAGLFAQGATGVAFDDFNFENAAGRCGVYRNGVWTKLGYPQLGQTNARLSKDMLTWLRAMSSMVRRTYPGKTMTAAVSPSVSGLANVKAAAPYLDMIFDESGYTDYGKRRLTGSAWDAETAALDYLNRHGKGFDINAIVNVPNDAAVTPSQLSWALANYLLVKGARSYTYVYGGKGLGFGGSPLGYGTFFARPEYHIPVGHPVSSAYVSNRLHMRRYSGGLVMVNATDSARYMIRLGRTYKNMEGRTISLVTLSPGTGIVLLTSPSQRKQQKRSSGSSCVTPRLYTAPGSRTRLTRSRTTTLRVVLRCPAV